MKQYNKVKKKKERKQKAQGNKFGAFIVSQFGKNVLLHKNTNYPAHYISDRDPLFEIKMSENC